MLRQIATGTTESGPDTGWTMQRGTTMTTHTTPILTPETAQIRVLLVDDQPAIRQGLRLRLSTEADLVVVGEASDGAEAIVLADTLRPDVIVLDVVMPGMDGFAAAKELRAVVPGSAIVMLSLQDDVASRARALTAGAAVFVAKHEADLLLVDAIRRVAATTGGP
jgi:DNA-binding NarL/FixJ family response regulator